MKRKGFTLLEILIVLSILMSVVLMTLPYTINRIDAGKIESNAKIIVSAIFTQEQSAYSGNQGSSYGIYFTKSQYSTFTGTSYATATSKTDFPLTSDIQLTPITLTGNATQVVFAQNSFRPNVSGTIVVKSDSTTYTVVINSEGLIYYHP